MQTIKLHTQEEKALLLLSFLWMFCSHQMNNHWSRHILRIDFIEQTSFFNQSPKKIVHYKISIKEWLCGSSICNLESESCWFKPHSALSQAWKTSVTLSFLLPLESKKWATAWIKLGERSCPLVSIPKLAKWVQRTSKKKKKSEPPYKFRRATSFELRKIIKQKLGF